MSHWWRAQGITSRIPAFLCGTVLLAVLVAGLAPFQSPRNTVQWLPHANGVQLRGHAIILSSRKFLTPVDAAEEAGATIELWLTPDRTDYSGTILAVLTPDNFHRISISQYLSNLVIITRGGNSRSPLATAGIEDAFRRGKTIFISVILGPRQSAIYVDGLLVHTFPEFRVPHTFVGELVLGTLPETNDNWSGTIHAFAIYRQELPAARISEHYESWMKRGDPALIPSDRATAVYLFDEHRGKLARNTVASGMDLYIPDHYKLPHQLFLQPFWTEFKPRPSYWEDISINVLGFVPLGFVFFAYWSRVRPIRRAVLVTTLFGLGISLLIEVLQAYLPTRTSGTTDLITNTLGTWIGVLLFRGAGKRLPASGILGLPAREHL